MWFDEHYECDVLIGTCRQGFYWNSEIVFNKEKLIMSLLCAVTHRKEDAARKLCPFTLTRINNNRDENQYKNDPSNPEQTHCDEEAARGCNCLTNRCMAWVDETDYFHGIDLGRCGLVSLSKNL